MKKILIIDNFIDPPYGCGEIRQPIEDIVKDFGVGADVFSLRGPDSQLPVSAEGLDAVVISGSKTRISDHEDWIAKEMALIQQLHDRKIPTLGICYGEQLIAKTLCGRDVVGPASQYEFGWTRIEKLAEAENSIVFSDLPKQFFSFSFHSDEVYTLPSDRFRIVMKSQDCPIQGYDVLTAPMWAVQFHPERLIEEGEAGLDRLIKREPQKILLQKGRGPELYDPTIARAIFKNFLSQVWGRKS